MAIQTFQVGELIGDHEVIEILGAGGMGQVYKVRNTISDRVEALKVLLPDLQGNPTLADRFLREIKVQAAMQHRNIAGLLGAQRSGDRILMFLEYVDGMNLGKALERGPLGPQLAASIIAQVADALSCAHARGVVHRDIKPENIMLQRDGAVKLMDFGIARVTEDRKLTNTGNTVGSLYYMSPEQIQGMGEIDGRSDLYSLGITLYQAVTGKRPFDGVSDYSIMSAHLNKQPVPPVQIDGSVPRALNDLILKAIAKDPGDRFQSADAFRWALDDAINGEYVPVTIPTTGAPMAPPGRPPQVPTAPTVAAIPVTARVAPPVLPPPIPPLPLQPPPPLPTPAVATPPQLPAMMYGPPPAPPPAPLASAKNPVLAAALALLLFPSVGAFYCKRKAIGFLLVFVDIVMLALNSEDTGVLFSLGYRAVMAWVCYNWARS